MANSQTIEARLCAYIDGSLDEAERSAIEHHLDAHPQHRAMIRDLLSMRRLVGNLPHLPAPADLGEGLQGQIERAMLLGEDEPEPSAIRTHFRRMKQRVALVGVLVLAAGLTVLVLQLLKGASKPSHIAEIAPAAPLPELPPLPQVPAALPATRPTEIAIVAPPDTQPVAIENNPTTEPAVSADVVADIGDELGTDSAETLPMVPTTQPEAIQAADTSTTQPTTLPVADDGGDK